MHAQSTLSFDYRVASSSETGRKAAIIVYCAIRNFFAVKYRRNNGYEDR